ncbi:MAG: MCE family protein [Candidatus Syntrophosphaera sp.]|nr:MCE family protein [Candidatus Syntrophosphaera sp.]
MVSKTAKTRLGIFVIAGGLLLLGFFIVVAGKSIIERVDTYYIEFENYSVSGLQEGGAVNYHGVPVGRIVDIKINPKDVTKVILTINIAKGTPVKEDSEAVTVMMGITGVKAVEIRGGTNESRLLKPKSYIKKGTTAIEDITDRAVSIAEKIEQIAVNIRSITDEASLANIGETLQNLNVVVANTAEMSRKLNQSIDRVNYVLQSAEIDSMVVNINAISAQLRDAKLDELIKELSKTTTTAGSLITNLDRALISNRANLAETLESLREASENLSDFTRQISEQPSIIWRGNE